MNESASQRVNEPPSNFSFLISNLPQTLLIFLVVVFALYFSALSLQQHWAFQTNGMDVGNVDQALWNTAQGRFLQFSLMTPVESRLALHVEPVLLLLVPFYWLGLGGPELLLVVQAGVVALGAWPLYQLSINNYQFSTADLSLRGPVKGQSNLLLLLFPLAYLLWPGLESAVLFEFHAVTLAPTFLLFAFLALEQKHDSRFLIFALLAMACKEDMPLVVAMLGLYAGLARRRWRLAGLTIGLSVLWFALAFFVIQPQFAAGGNIQLDRYAWLGDNPAAMLQTIITQPAQVAAHLQAANLFGYLFNLFLPTAFLALLSPLTLLPMLPTLAVNLLSANPFQWRLEDFHYAAPLAPFLFVSAIYGIRRISELANQRISESTDQPTSQPANQPTTFIPILTALLLIFSLMYHILRGYTPLARPFAWPTVTAHHHRLGQVVATIPPDSALFTQANLAPHLSQRQTIYTEFAYFTDPNFPAKPVDDILLDVTAFENSGGLHQFLADTLLTSGHYRLITATDGILHFEPQPDSPTPDSLLPTPFFTFTQPDAPPQYPVTVDFGDMLRLRGYTLHFDRQEEVQVSVDLEPLQPLTADLQPVLYLLDDTGQPLGATTDPQPALVWHPVEQWSVGEVVRVRFNTLPWHTRARQQYRLALGIISGNDPWAGPQRYPPAIVQAEALAPRLPGAGTLLELARLEQTWQMPYGGPSLRQFKIPASARPPTANFDNQISLHGISPKSPIVNRQSSIFITLTWQALATPPDLTRFVQLVGPDGRVYSQNDAAPDNGQYPTRLWQPGEVVVETVTLPLPPDRPPGPYTLHLGLYHPDTGARLPLLSGGDHVEVALGQLGD